MKPEEICKIVCSECDFYKQCPIHADSDICATLRSCQDITNHYEQVIIPERVETAVNNALLKMHETYDKKIIPARIVEVRKGLIEKVFHEFFEGSLSGWVACCVDENCQKTCLWHDLEKLEQQLKKDMV